MQSVENDIEKGSAVMLPNLEGMRGIQVMKLWLTCKNTRAYFKRIGHSKAFEFSPR